MCGLGVSEIVVILILALILLGPKQLPDVAKQLGKAMREFKKATDDLKGQFEGELYDERPKAPPPPRIREQRPTPAEASAPPPKAPEPPTAQAAEAPEAPAPATQAAAIEPLVEQLPAKPT